MTHGMVIGDFAVGVQILAPISTASQVNVEQSMFMGSIGLFTYSATRIDHAAYVESLTAASSCVGVNDVGSS